ncbi:uncharacterized protein EV154DRAFT_547402 [Mucor mucedo]|uniref:uncharacterized protein n=1 Tax=Mucor mucedo TaxID=29922 RepID=UPI0022200578|nr:uncharacterized protein EV154DRAFT_547402 [Mucor mucedo]KAI7896401.1 hypothetical protein EV154DRAFT_547402 [Mucor mucedo]
MDSDRSLSGTPGTPGSNMSTSSSLAPGDRIISVKSSIDGIGWDPERRERLEEYVVTVHNITTHAYSLSKYIFLRAIQEDENFDIRRCINRDFFAEVWLKLTRYARGRAGGRTAATRAFIDTYLDDYLEVTGFVPPDFRYGQQASLIEGAKIFTSYSNNVQMRLGSHLRQAVNHLLRIRQRKAELIAYRRREGLIDALIKSEVYREITEPATRFKELIARRLPQDFVLDGEQFGDPIYNNALEILRPVLTSYPVDYRFRGNSIYFDSKARLVEHMRAFYELALLFIDIELPVFNCFPLRRSWIPCYTTIDSKILCQNILGRRWTNRQDKIALWREVINLNSDALKHQENGELQFRGTIQTDGVGVTVIKKRMDRESRYTARFAVVVESIQYISQEIAQETVGRCVTIDPGRRDLLFCVHENSTANNPNKFRFTKQYQDKFEKIKKYRRIREAVKPARVAAAERLLVNYDSLNRDEFEQYLENRSNMTGIIQNHYVNFRTNHRTAHPLQRKLRLSAYIRRQQGNEDLISKLDEQFGVEAVYVMGNWSSPNARFHEPVRGLGFRRLLQKAGKRVYLIDEFRTSQCCPACERRSLETFRMVDNPRPHRRRANPRVIRHGLLRAMTNNTNRIVPRLWNRDMAACLNMVDIVRSLRAGNGIPPRFRRGEVPQNQRRRARTQNEQANIRNVRQRRN